MNCGTIYAKHFCDVGNVHVGWLFLGFCGHRSCPEKMIKMLHHNYRLCQYDSKSFKVRCLGI